MLWRVPPMREFSRSLLDFLSIRLAFFGHVNMNLPLSFPINLASGEARLEDHRGLGLSKVGSLGANNNHVQWFSLCFSKSVGVSGPQWQALASPLNLAVLHQHELPLLRSIPWDLVLADKAMKFIFLLCMYQLVFDWISRQQIYNFYRILCDCAVFHHHHHPWDPSTLVSICQMMC